MDRRSFLAASAAAAGLSAMDQRGALAQAVLSRAPAPDAGANAQADGPLLVARPVVSGPAAESITILQPIAGPATGFVEFAIDDAPFERVDAGGHGLLPYEPHVLKFRLPGLPAGRNVRYRVTAHRVDWRPVRQFIHGEIVTAQPEVGPEKTFRTLDPSATETRFIVWNDTHENSETLKALAQQTAARRPDFLLWNGDQTNDVHYEADISGQVLSPAGVELASSWPLAYARGNHDLRGPAARNLTDFTGTPNDRYYYAFRSGPVAVLVMDTGEDKPDDHPVFGGLAAFVKYRERQTKWLAETVQAPWFAEAPFRVLFCHIPLWWIKDRRDIDYWEFSKVCRDAWTPLLAEAGVQLVISGHTHDHAWLPATEKQPLGQLIGGGPKPAHATLIEGLATRDKLTLTVQKLDGKVVHVVELNA